MASFTVSGRRIELTKERVESQLRKIEPDVIRTHAVEINGYMYPVKQAFAAATGLDTLDFNTDQSRRILKALGFRVARVTG
jgi:hypothetical protein